MNKKVFLIISIIIWIVLILMCIFVRTWIFVDITIAYVIINYAVNYFAYLSYIKSNYLHQYSEMRKNSAVLLPLGIIDRKIDLAPFVFDHYEDKKLAHNKLLFKASFFMLFTIPVVVVFLN